MTEKLPIWLHQKLPKKSSYFEIKKVLEKAKIPTVCEEAKCPNRFICFEKKCATFLALGRYCTRRCLFCDIEFSLTPLLPDLNEPIKIATLAKKLNLKHIVITMVTRDDLPDFGAIHIAKIIKETKRKNSGSTIEVLTSDFQGKTPLLDIIIEAKPDIFNHNIETTDSLTSKIRDKASYDTSLKVLKFIKEKESSIQVKSGLMVGLGESEEEVKKTISDLKSNGCDIITIGQYLRPSKKCIEVTKYITPKTFEKYQKFGLSIGVKKMQCAPLVRSSFNAKEILSF